MEYNARWLHFGVSDVNARYRSARAAGSIINQAFATVV